MWHLVRLTIIITAIPLCALLALMLMLVLEPLVVSVKRTTLGPTRTLWLKTTGCASVLHRVHICAAGRRCVRRRRGRCWRTGGLRPHSLLRLLRLLTTHHLLLYLHLLHHLRVHHHALLGHRGHGLLHHGWVDRRHLHTAAATAELLLHGGHVTLHVLPVLGHHLRREPVVGGTLSRVLGVHARATVVEVVAVVVVAVVVPAVAEAVVPIIEVLASGLGLLHFNLRQVRNTVLLSCRKVWKYRLAEDGEVRAVERIFDGGLAIEGDETETTRSTGIFVHHQSSVKNTAELHEVFPEIGFSSLLANTTDEDLGGLLLFITGDGSFRVDLVGC